MEKYRRKRQITDQEINRFQTIDIEKIITTTPEKQTMIARPFVFALSTFLIVLIGLGLWIFTREPNSPVTPINNQFFSVEKLGDFQYSLSSKDDELPWVFTYDASIVHHGTRQSFNDIFDYQSPYLYVSDSILDQSTILFNAFRTSDFRYYIEIIYNNISVYVEVNLFEMDRNIERLRSFQNLENMEIEDFQTDISLLYALIEAYPPIQPLGDNVPYFQPNPEINDIEESRAKRNYFTYISNYYIPENFYASDEENHLEFTNPNLSVHQYIVVDEDGAYQDSELAYKYCYGNCPIESDSFFVNLNRFYEVYPHGSDDFLNAWGILLEDLSNTYTGYFKALVYQDSYYASIVLESNTDLNALEIIDYIHFEVVSNSGYGLETYTFDLPAIYYNQMIIVEPTYLFDIDALIQEIPFSELTIQLYDAQNNLLGTLHKVEN